MCLWREVSTPQVRLWFLWCTTLFLSKMNRKQWSAFCFQKSFLPFTHSGAYLVSPHTPATSPSFCPKDGSTCRSPVRRSVSSAARRCAPKAVPASPADPGKQRRAGKHCRWTKGASGVFGWKNSVEFFFFLLLLLYKKRKGKGIWERREKVGPFRRYVCYCVRSRSCYNVTVVCFGGEVCLGMLWTYSQPFFLVFGWKCCEGDSYQPGWVGFPPKWTLQSLCWPMTRCIDHHHRRVPHGWRKRSWRSTLAIWAWAWRRFGNLLMNRDSHQFSSEKTKLRFSFLVFCQWHLRKLRRVKAM